MFFSLSYSFRLNRQLIYYKSYINYNVRKYSLSNNEKTSSHEQIYMRSVLRKTNGCTLFEPAKKDNNLILNRESTEENQIISMLISAHDKLKKYKSTNYSKVSKELLHPLNIYCLDNYRKWSIKTQLYACDIWHFVDGARKFPIFDELMKDFLIKFIELKNGPSLQVLYYIAWSKRKFSPNVEVIVTKKFEEILTDLSLDEISIYCLALIKSESAVKNFNLVKSLYDCLMKNNLENYDNIGVTGVIKAVRRFSTADHINELKILQNKLIPFAKRANLMSLTHIIQLGSKQRVFNEQLIEAVLRRFSNNLSELRIKDVERALLSISTCNNKNSAIQCDFLNKIQNHLLMSLDTKFSYSLIRCISYLVVCGNVNEKLIDWALNPKTHADTYGLTIDQDEHALLLIDSYAKINLKNSYSGHRLPEELCVKLMPRLVKIVETCSLFTTPKCIQQQPI